MTRAKESHIFPSFWNKYAARGMGGGIANLLSLHPLLPEITELRRDVPRLGD